MKRGRVISFVFLTVGGGLLQLWILAIVRYVNGQEISAPLLLGDGGLFFFSTSLAFNSFMSLVSDRPLSFGTADLNVTMALLAPITILAVGVYSSVLSSALGQNPAPFADHVPAQAACAIAALAYMFYVALVTGFLRGKP